MYIDKTIELRTDLPNKLVEDLEILENYYADGDWLNFDTYFEAFEGTVKAHYIAGKIQLEDLNLIFEKYGIA